MPTLFCRGGDGFFLVATVQEAAKTPPEVKVEGTGLNARVTVGQRRVAFRNDRVVIEDAL